LLVLWRISQIETWLISIVLNKHFSTRESEDKTSRRDLGEGDGSEHRVREQT
jgi:hypothetical protein